MSSICVSIWSIPEARWATAEPCWRGIQSTGELSSKTPSERHHDNSNKTKFQAFSSTQHLEKILNSCGSMEQMDSWIINFLKRSPSAIRKTQQLKRNLQVRRSLNLFDSAQEEMLARERLTQHILSPSTPRSGHHLNRLLQLHYADLQSDPTWQFWQKSWHSPSISFTQREEQIQRDKSSFIPSFTDHPQQFSLKSCSCYYQHLFFSKENKNKRWQSKSCKRSLDQTDVSIGSHTSHVLSRILKVPLRDMPSFAMIIERPTVFS